MSICCVLTHTRETRRKKADILRPHSKTVGVILLSAASEIPPAASRKHFNKYERGSC